MRVFIDGSYLFRVFDPYRAQGYHYSVKVMVRHLSEGFDLAGVYYFGSYNPFNKTTQAKQEAFYYGVLRDIHGYDVKILPLKRIAGQLKEKGMDIALAKRLSVLANQNAFDVAIIVAADGDYSDTVEEVKALGKTVVNAYFSVRRSHDLQQACGRWVRLDSIPMIYPKNDASKLVSVAALPAPKRA